MTAAFCARFIDPIDGSQLTFMPIGDDSDGLWQSENSRCWPQIDGVAYLRANREPTAIAAADHLAAGRRPAALGLLLADTDDFAPAVPSLEGATAVGHDVAAGCCSARSAMQRLAYGPVADYFGLRAGTPTFLSGLALLAEHGAADAPVVEIACGIGHFLDHLHRHGAACTGCDVTFSKLWLGRQFLLSTDVALVCADIAAGAYFPIAANRPATVLCHDAFYFFADKPRAATRLQELATDRGRVLLGHVHLKDFDHGGVAGDLCDARGYASLFNDVRHIYDDAELATSVIADRRPIKSAVDELTGHEALALVAGAESESARSQHWRHEPADTLLYANPLLSANADGALHPNWPSAAFAREYANATYLSADVAPSATAAPRRAKFFGEAARRRHVLPGAFVALATDPVRWAVVGCGWVARDYAIPAFAHTPSARLAAISDPDAAKRDRCGAERFDSVRAYADHRELLADGGIDAVYIATPNDTHARLVCDAANAGCHVFCEKPIATRPRDARAMLAACEAAGVRYATAFDQRFHEAHHVLREAVRAGRLGRVTQARVHYACQVDAAWTATPGDSDNWRLDPARAGGGAVIDLAPHAIDLVSMLLDQEPVALSIRLQGRLGNDGSIDERVDAGGLLCLDFSDGSLASVHVSYQCPEFLPRRELELIGTRGGARAIDTMGQTPGGRIEWHTPAGPSIEHFDDDPGLSPFARQIEAFSACLAHDRPFAFDAARDLAHFELLFEALAKAATPAPSAHPAFG